MAMDANAGHAGWRSRGYLPHVDAPDTVQHVVFRVADSLPAWLRDEFALKPPAERIEAADAALDEGHGRRDLAIPEVAEMVQNALLAFDGQRYALLAWCVMPNHVHALAEIRSGHRLDRVVHSWKSFTAHTANRTLLRTGRFGLLNILIVICAMTISLRQHRLMSKRTRSRPVCAGNRQIGYFLQPVIDKSGRDARGPL